MAAPLTDDERERILDAIRAGGTCRGIAADHGRSTDAVRRIAAEAGITDAFARERTKSATEARRADTDARLAELRAALVEDAHRLRAGLWAPAVLHHWYQGQHYEHVVEQPTTGDMRNLAVALGIVVDKIDLLDRRSDNEHSAVDSWLLAMFGLSPEQAA